MRKLILFFLFALLPFAAQAQLKFGYLSYSNAIKTLPGYALMQENMARLKAQYDGEAQRAEDDFNAKYQAFLEVQNTLATPILRKRQAELQELLDKNVAFKAEADRLLRQAEADMYAPLKTQLNEALKRIGEEHGYMLILNSDNDNLPYVNEMVGEDITTLVKEALTNQ